MSALQNADSTKYNHVYKNYNIKQIHKHDKGNIFFLETRFKDLIWGISPTVH